MSVVGSHRLGGAAMIIGAVLTFLGNALHPSVPEHDIAAYAQEATEALWVPIHAFVLVGVILVVLGFVNLYGVLRENGEATYSLTALYSVALMTVVGIVAFVLDGFVSPVLAADYLAATGAAQESLGLMMKYNSLVELSLLVVFFLLLAFSLGLFGASMLRAEIYNSALAAAGIILGLIFVIGYTVGAFGTYFGFSAFFTPLATVTLVWFIAVGYYLYKGST